MVTKLTSCDDLLMKRKFAERVYSMLFTQLFAELKTNKKYTSILSDLVGGSHCAFNQNAFISLITKLDTASATKKKTLITKHRQISKIN